MKKLLILAAVLILTTSCGLLPVWLLRLVPEGHRPALPGNLRHPWHAVRSL